MQTDDFHVFDTTLRDGAQREGITYSVADKLAVARLLDQLGVGFIEGGWPGAMPKDTEFFARAADGELALKHAVLVAFGATRKAGVEVEDDPQVRALLDSRAPVVTLVAKSDVWHVERRAAHHARGEPGDGARHRRLPARRGPARVRRLRALLRRLPARSRLRRAGARRRGRGRCRRRACCATPTAACCPMGVHDVVADVRRRAGIRLGIHTQDDTGCAVANTLAAVDAGATHVQGTANGYGERAGNANIFSVIGGLVTKMGRDVLPDGCLAEMQRVSHAIAEIANLAPDTHAPYVGASAFAHKAGLHASAIKVAPELYNHLDPAVVGNDQRILVTEMAGRASVELKSAELGVDVTSTTRRRWARSSTGSRSARRRAGRTRPPTRRSSCCCATSSAGAVDAVHRRVLPGHRRPARGRRDGQRGDGEGARRRGAGHLHRGGQRPGQRARPGAAQGARHAPTRSWPSSSSPTTRCASCRASTAPTPSPACSSRRRTGEREWTTVGVHGNVIEASWLALHDAVRYGLLASRLSRPPGALDGQRGAGLGRRGAAGRRRASAGRRVRVGGAGERTQVSQVCAAARAPAPSCAHGRR